MLGEIKKLGSESLVYGISSVLTRLLNFFLVPLYTHYLLPDDYGRIAAVFSFIAFINIFYIMGLNQGYMRFKTEENLSKIMSFIIMWGFLLSILIMISDRFFAGLSGIEKENSRLIFYAVLIVYLDSISAVPLADLRMEHRAYSFAFIRSFSIVLNVILNFIFLKYTDYKMDGVFYAAIISSFAQLLMLKSYLKKFVIKIDFSSMREIFSYSLPFVPSSFSSVFIQLFDRPVMMHFLSPYYVGLYQANFRLGVVTNLVVLMFDFAWRPFVIERINRADASVIFSKVFDYFSFTLIYISFILSLFIKDIISIPFGNGYLINPNYWSACDIVSLIMLGYVFSGFYICFTASTIITKKTVYSMKANIISAAVSVLLNFILIPRYGIYGAAFSFLIANMVLAFYMYFTAEKIFKIGYSIVKPLVLIVLSASVYYILENYLSSCSCKIFQIKVFICIVYPFAAGASGYFDRNDVNIIRDWILKKIFHR